MHWLVWGLVAIALVAAAGLAYVRLAPLYPDRWHQDPMTAPGTGRPNEWRVGPADAPVPMDAPAPIWALSADALARQIDAAILAEPRTQRIAGSPEDGFATYVQRTPLIGFPDYVGVRVIALEEGRATLAIWSRARFGHGDMGVNRARVEAWLRRLPAPEGAP